MAVDTLADIEMVIRIRAVIEWEFFESHLTSLPVVGLLHADRYLDGCMEICFSLQKAVPKHSLSHSPLSVPGGSMQDNALSGV